uniref:DNA pilot protein n=1 Tax=Dulem virus 219 TaxID=3145696 RepID=A0AAU8B5R6_9VIRU
MGSFLKALGGIATDLFTGQVNSSLSSLRGQAYNERNMALQNKYQKDMVDYIFQKNDPARAADRWRRAGIAPQAVFGNSPGGAGVASDASAPSSSNPDNDSRSFNFVRTLAERQAMDNEKAVADATVNKLNAEADKLRGDTKDPDVTKRQQKLEFDWTLVKKEREEVQLEIDKINKQYEDAMKQADLSIKQQILFETLAKIDKLLADTEVSKQMKENLKSQKALIEAQTKTEGSKQRNLDSSSALNDSERRTVDALRDGRVKLTNRQADQVLREIGLSEARTLNEYEDLVKAMTGTAPASSLWSYVDRLIARLDSEKGGYANADELRRRLASSLLSFIDEND